MFAKQLPCKHKNLSSVSSIYTEKKGRKEEREGEKEGWREGGEKEGRIERQAGRHDVFACDSSIRKERQMVP